METAVPQAFTSVLNVGVVGGLLVLALAAMAYLVSWIRANYKDMHVMAAAHAAVMAEHAKSLAELATNTANTLSVHTSSNEVRNRALEALITAHAVLTQGMTELRLIITGLKDENAGLKTEVAKLRDALLQHGKKL